MTRKRLTTLIVGVVAVLAVAVVAFVVFRPHGDQNTQHPAGTDIPAAAWSTLEKIDAGQWPRAANAPGTKGGDRWRNAERRLPEKDSSGKPVRYKEWDVNPKRKGHSRDAQRIITGSDHSAWYTGDHYKTFERMR